MSLSDLPKLWTEPTKIHFFNISWSSNQIFFTEKKIGKIQPIFYKEKWVWKYEFWDVQGGCS